MLIRQILEHKKGVKAVKYNKKPKAHTPADERKVIGPDVPKKQDVAESSRERCMQCGMKNCSCPGDSCKCKPIAGWVPGKGFKKAVEEAANAAQQAAIAISKKEQGVEEAGMYRQSGSQSAYDRDYASSVSGMGRRERDMDDESNLLYVYKDGRVMQKMVSNRVEREARSQGYRDSPEQALKMHGIIRSKFKPGKWVQKQGDQWVEVFPFGKPDDITETATPGATSAGNVATLGMNPKLSPGPARGKKSYIGSPGKSGTKAPPQPKVIQPKGKNGTAKNALDMKSNIFGGGKAIKRK